MGKSLWQEDFGDVGSILKGLQTEGVTTSDTARFRSSPKQRLVVGQAFKAGRDSRAVQADIVAIEPFGPAVFGAEDWLRMYAVGPDCIPEASFPWSWQVLNGPCPFYSGKTVAETHFAFLGSPLYRPILTDTLPSPLTIRQWKKLHPHAEQSRRRFYQNQLPWATDEPFMREIVQPRWYLMLRNPVPGSERFAYRSQVDLLPPQYKVPSAIEAVTMMLLAIEKSSILCCANQFGRVSNTTVDDELVRLDLHSQDMIPGQIGIYHDNGEIPSGIFASRLLPSTLVM